MAAFPFAAAISAGGSLLGGLLGSKSNDKATAANIDAQKNAVSWRVADAKRAGIHPLAALGVPTAGPVATASNALGEGIAGAGQAVANYASNREMADLQRQQIEANIAKTYADRAASITASGASLTQQRWIEQQIMDSKLQRARQALNAQQDFNVQFGDGRKQPSNPIGIEELITVPFIDMYTQWDNARQTRHGDVIPGTGLFKHGDYTDPEYWRSIK